MLPAVLWYLVVTLLGLLTFPLAYRLLPGLPGRGYAFSRALGLLIWGFVFWLLSSLGVLANDLGGLTFALAVLLALSLWALRSAGAQQVAAWLRENLSLVFLVEGLFLLAFVAWTLVRAMEPSITGTEKPMELAFINAILRSPAMPPHDPWLSGWAISYYYFGYVLVAMLAKLTGVPGGVAFNLGVSLVFALTAAGAYGLVYDLLAASRPRARGGNLVGAFLAPLFVLVVGNAEGLLEVLHTRGLFWRQDASGALTSSFWRWLDIENLRDPPSLPFGWVPSRHLWWWRASRVIQDYTLETIDGNLIDKEVINEFPHFSYTLADLHPHVLAMSFAFLAMALALNLFLGGGRGSLRLLNTRFDLDRPTFLLGALASGGMAFLNIWDFPIYVALFAGAYALRRAGESGWGWVRLREFLTLGLALGVGGVLLYLPYYVGFSSQAGGLLPNLVYPTRGAQLWVMFGVLWLPMLAYLAWRWSRQRDWKRLVLGLSLALVLAFVLWVFSLLLTVFIVQVLPDLEFIPQAGQASSAFLGDLGASSLPELLLESLERRRVNNGGWITMVGLLGLVAGLLWPRAELLESGEGAPAASEKPSSHTFALLMLLVGALLVLGPEFVYLRDLFGYRINTIFKFYYQAWLLWSAAVAFGSVALLRALRPAAASMVSLLLLAVLAVGLVYPALRLGGIVDSFRYSGRGLTLDGTLHTAYLSADDRAAIAWLRDAPPGALAEAVGGSYSDYGRISAHSGQAAVLGWDWHEVQWRGGGEEIGSRRGDIERLYATRDWQEAQAILDQYGIRYVYVGPLERSTYRVDEGKFMRFLTPVFRQGEVTIYEYPAADLGLRGKTLGASP